MAPAVSPHRAAHSLPQAYQLGVAASPQAVASHGQQVPGQAVVGISSHPGNLSAHNGISHPGISHPGISHPGIPPQPAFAHYPYSRSPEAYPPPYDSHSSNYSHYRALPKPKDPLHDYPQRTPSSVGAPSPASSTGPSHGHGHSLPTKFTPSSIVSLLNDVPTPNPIDAYNTNRSPSSVQDPSMLQFFDEGDLNLLATDLNNIVNNIMFESNFSGKYAQFDGETPENSFKSSMITPPQTSIFPETYPGRNIPTDKIKLKKPLERRYLHEFCEDFVNLVLPFPSYDKSLKCYFNPARDIILLCAAQESFLLAAVLAHGAKTLFLKENKPEDEEAYCTYLSKCLKLLGPALVVGGRSKNQQNGLSSDLTSNIESVLVTVLLLTSANAANPKQNWRPHLRGAKDILLKVSTFKIKSSKVLIFCKFWFGTLEILAGVSSTLGGTLKSEAELDSLVTTGDDHEIKVLEEIGLIVHGGFNIISGYHNDALDHIRDLIKILAKIRKNKNYQPENEFEYFRLLSEFYRLSQLEFIDKKCILNPADFVDGVPNADLIDVLSHKSKDGPPPVIISWMDTCHQAYVLASMITILVKCFKEKHDSPQVQMISNKLISRMAFLKDYQEADIPNQSIKCSMMMMQWPMLVAAMNCTNKNDQDLLRKFFRVSGHVGSASSKFALARAEKVWSLREKGEHVDSDIEDDYNDVLSY
ncbi:uncharacterized protein CANTADRAFT_57295 [Suhomyces tanzawaensis NRRL Y-17324]|uniref:Transcription factor domain-containing protein n=1 Tax=Suhomyces tanzawaensis NRRL Y-17324 TaxID=984487 RepID=A0A1E4SBU5_9ASCO|nr:uncharacterized protein CANTADRAFT_57295 [Suhomyces tanzawaensis NRRL Y-17324]ODV76862.1 hypothetical protein CANTADRAFT_57295 [Suhomyces tanzawaensis NRRL Y-17324]